MQPTITRSLTCANTLILAGMLGVAAVVLGTPLTLADERGHWLPFRVGLVLAVPAVTLMGTAWSGWIALRESRPRRFWSRALFTLGMVLSLAESLWILWILLGIGAA